MMNESIAAVTGILVLATIAEALVEYLLAPIVEAKGPSGSKSETAVPWRSLALRYCAALIGVALSVVYQVDLLAFFNLSSPWPWVGWVITGILIGRGSNFVHDFASRWLTKPALD
jgi:hypothetical protein